MVLTQMSQRRFSQKVVFCTFSDFKTGASGDATNDRKLFFSVPPIFDIILISPQRKLNNRLKMYSLIKTLLLYLKEIFSSNNIFITRGHKLAILPIIFKRINGNKVIIRLGCTPSTFVEKQAFLSNLEYNKKSKRLQNIFNYIVFIIENFTLRNADKFIVENAKAAKIANIYGAKPSKVKIIPYYVQDYFLRGKNPSYDKKKNYFKIGYTGRFKEYDLLIPAITAISFMISESYKIKFYLIGDGPNQENIKKLVKKKDLTNNIKFLGSKSHKEVSKLIDDYHCLLLPMLSNTCPSTIAIKVLECVMKGKIAITTKSGNNPSLFLKNIDLILKNASTKNIAEKIKMVIENYEIYKIKAEELSQYHRKLRSKIINKQKINELLIDLTL